jgi:alcohol dehydrogenase (cytochrome c)
MTLTRLLPTWVPISGLVLAGALAAGQTGLARDLAPADLLKPLGKSWPSYSGDYTGKRFSPLAQVNQTTVKQLSLAWTVKLTAGAAPVGRWGGGPTAIVGGNGSPSNPAVATIIKGTPLMVNGVLYVTSPDNGWALDARDGREMWHYFWRTRGGTPIGNRGFGLWNDALFMVTPDDFIVSLDAKTGKERWNKEFAPFTQQYFSTIAPMVIGNTVIVGTGNDLDSPGYLQAYDADTGKELWRFYTVPQNAGDPGVDTWPSLQAARYGGGHPWLPGVYDPETNLYIFGTGNPIPAYTLGRGEGDNLFTCALIAVDVATGKMKWYFQTSPHDMHDWDSAQTPVLFEATVGGKKRKLVSTAARNGYFFTLDRTTGEKVVVTKYGSATNWAASIDPKGSVRREPTKDPIVAGALTSPTSGGTINWEPPAYSPLTGLFYVSERNGHSIYYLTDPDPRGSMGLAGKEESFVGNTGNFLTAIDPLTGKVAWRRPYPSAGGTGMYGGGGSGLLTTAGKLVFGGDNGGNLVAWDAVTGTPIWHTHIGDVTNPPMTYMLDGRQYILVATTDTLYAFALYQ